MTSPHQHIPDVITRYLDAAADSDYDAVVACFTEDATVTDEDRLIRGHAAIRSWRENLAGQFTYTVAVLEAVPRDNGWLVTARVEGDFPGSPVQLRYAFTLAGDLISSLVIAP